MRALSFHRRRRASAPRRRTGFSVVEIMVAMTLLGVVMMSLGGLALSVARRGRANALVAGRTFAMQQQSNKFLSMPFDSLGTFPTAAKGMLAGEFKYTRYVSITQVANDRYRVKILIVPASSAAPGDSLVFDRTRPPTSSVLCSGCP